MGRPAAGEPQVPRRRGARPRSASGFATQVAANKPYDKFAYEILTASGSNVDESRRPRTSRFSATPTTVMENTTQLFLAVRFNCNKCHDHPFEKWTQDQYYTLAAFFAQVEPHRRPEVQGPEDRRHGGRGREAARRNHRRRARAGEIKHVRTGEVARRTFPYTVNARPAADRHAPRAGREVDHLAEQPVLRQELRQPHLELSARRRHHRTGRRHPRRQPADQPGTARPLTEEFIESGFDVRKLIKTICKSRTYQLSIATNKWNKDDEINYSHALARRLPAEVLFDSIHHVDGIAQPAAGAAARCASVATRR